MRLRRAGILALLMAVAVLLAACGGGNEPDAPTPTGVSVEIPTTEITGDQAIATSVQQTVAAISVAQTVAALTTGQPVATAQPAATSQPTEVAAATSTVAPASATTAPTQPPPTNPPPTQPPPTNPPPTTVPPTPIPTATTLVIGPPPTSQNKPNAGTCVPGEDVQNIITEIILDPNYLFRVTAFDNRVGVNDGDGIDEIEFSITSNEIDNFFYENTESNPAYCVFEGGEPNCNTWGIDDQGRYHWGPNGPIVEPGEYFVLITLRWDENRPDELSGQSECNWNSGDQPLVITLP
jgi:hypothetical protein